MDEYVGEVGRWLRACYVCTHTYQVEKESFCQDLDNRILANRTTLWKRALRLLAPERQKSVTGGGDHAPWTHASVTAW